MQYRAKISYLRIAPRKVRLVADLVRGDTIEHAEQQLEFSTKRASYPMLKLIKSAVVNAKRQNENLNEAALFIKELRVDEGPMLKRYRGASRGRQVPIEKGTSHVTLIIAEKEQVMPKSKTKSKSKSEKVKAAIKK